MTGSRYYVTLCVKTETATKAIQWGYNAQFETLSAAERHRDSLIPLVDKINSAPPNPKRIPNIEGERIMAITSNPAPGISYLDPSEIEGKPHGNLRGNAGIEKSKKEVVPTKRKNKKTPEYVQLYHGPKVKKSTAKWLEKKQENATIVLFSIIAVMLAIAWCNQQP